MSDGLRLEVEDAQRPRVYAVAAVLAGGGRQQEVRGSEGCREPRLGGGAQASTTAEEGRQGQRVLISLFHNSQSCFASRSCLKW